MSIGGFNKHKWGFNQQKCGVSSIQPATKGNWTTKKRILQGIYNEQVGRWSAAMGLNDDWLFELDLGFWARSNQIKTLGWGYFRKLLWLEPDTGALKRCGKRCGPGGTRTLRILAWMGRCALFIAPQVSCWQNLNQSVNFNQRLCCRAQQLLGLWDICSGLLIDKGKSLDHIRSQSCGLLQFTYQPEIRTGFGQMAICVCQKLMFCKKNAEVPVFLCLPILCWTLKPKQLMPDFTI